MKSSESPADADYGSRVLAAFRKRGLSTRRWNRASIQAIEKASRLEFLDLYKRHDKQVSYALIEVLRTRAPEEFVARLVKEKAARDQMVAMMPIKLMHVL